MEGPGFGDFVPDIVKQFVHYLYRHIRWAAGSAARAQPSAGALQQAAKQRSAQHAHARPRACAAAAAHPPELP